VSSVLVLVLAAEGGASADEHARAVAGQRCPRPFEVKIVRVGAAPGRELDAAVSESQAEIVAFCEAGRPPGPHWLEALVRALDADATAGAAAGALGRSPGGPARFTLDDGEDAYGAFLGRVDAACRLPLASCAVRRAAWDEVRFDPEAPLGELGPRLARGLLETGWAKIDTPEAQVSWTGPIPAAPRWEPVIFSSPARRRTGPTLTRAAKLLRTGARAVEVLRDAGPRGVLQRLRERSEPERAWYEQVPWSLLSEPRPAHAPPRAGALAGPLTINWVVPAFYPGSGGHMTIFRLVRQLEELGHACRVIFTHTEGLLPPEGTRLRALVREHFQPVRARCIAFRGQPLPEADVHVATAWDTAFVVDRRRAQGAGAYLVQDWEPSFYPVGTRGAVAEQTYALGLQHVTAGPWLAERLRARGLPAVHFELAVDAAEHFVEPGAAAPAAGRMAVYLRPLTERRGFEVVSLALAEVKRQRPAAEIAVYGTPQGELMLPFAAAELGVLTPAGLRRLYCGSTLGVSCSLTNHSLAPQEMWACGLPVVEIDGESTRAVYRDGEDVALAPFEPRALAARIVGLLDDEPLRRRLAEAGLKRAALLDWRKSAQQVERGLRLAVEMARAGVEG
jgi:glycosyltransferase involved in cell wall biosynthesis